MFVPELSDVLAGLHRILERDVIPSIDDPYGRSQAMLVSMQLRDLTARWEALPAIIEQESAEMRHALAECEHHLAGDASDATLVAEARRAIRAQLDRAYAERLPARSVGGLAVEHTDLLATIEAVLRAIIELERLGLADSAVEDGHRAIRAVLRRHAESRDPGVDASTIRHRN